MIAQPTSSNISQALDILHGRAPESPQQLLTLAKALKDEQAFGYARKLLGRARKEPIDDANLKLMLAQQHAICTYKDPDLPADARLDRALDILTSAVALDSTNDPESLGIAGAIHKRKWELDAQQQHLERALAYYRRGYAGGPAADYGYTGINTAFMLDLLANLEREQAQAARTTSGAAEERQAEAQRIRADLIATLPALADRLDQAWLSEKWWFLVTIAEAYFGCEQYDQALVWLRKAKQLPHVPRWEYQSTARQLAALARLQRDRVDATVPFEQSAAGRVLREFLDGNHEAVMAAFVGKVGLALSGGGFRAALFHIGVLARLAELDVLRSVEVLSCVSGGSVIGAHYYLEVRQLLQTKPDSEITRDDYIAIVERVARDFLAGVQKNIRTRVAAEPSTNLKMLFQRNYSRTQRTGELFEQHIFAHVADGQGDQPRWLDQLRITPKDAAGTFEPKYDNWQRRAKAPILILNAATLNTGHNWQFTASWMGESPASIDSEIDGNYRLRRMYYNEAPEPYRHVRLGHAVAASACVPGLFEPLALDGLYPGIVVRLVDGGTHDNQGNVGLLEQDCTLLLISDAGGQMQSQNNPSMGLLGVSLRSTAMLMARVRTAQHHDLAARRRAALLRGLMFVHLKKDLSADPRDWVNCADPYDASDEARPAEQRGILTSYGIEKEVQARLAAIRTDLDSFNDVEAYALMTSAYRMTERDFKMSISGFPIAAAPPHQWEFLAIEPQMKRPHSADTFTQLLDTANQRAFKIWRLSRPLRVSARMLGGLALLGLIWAIWTWRDTPLLTIGSLGVAIAAMVASLIVGPTLVGLVRYRQTLLRIAIGVSMGLLGWLAAWVHLRFFDPLYLRHGKIERFIDNQQ